MRFAMCIRVGVVIGVASMLFFVAPNAVAITEDGSVSVSGVVPGPPPATPPTIDEPTTGRTFDQKNITVSGNCLPNLIVKIFRNGIFAGSAICQADGTYTLAIDLMEGKNDLLARQYDTLNQPSPDSAITTVYYVPLASQPTLPGEAPITDSAAPPSSQPPSIAQFGLVIDYDLTMQGIFAGKPFNLPLKLNGGTPPYAVSIEWGDGTTSVFSRENNQRFTAEHVYEHGGLYTVKIRVSDRNGNEAFVQFVLVVNGRPGNIVVRSLFNAVQFGGWWVTLILLSLLIGFIGLIFGFLLARYIYHKKRKKQKS